MYTHQSLQDLLFLMLYGGVAILALVAAIYIALRRSNAFSTEINPPKSLRLWTSAFFAMAALSHIWWYTLGIHCLTEDRLVRNITAVTLDHVTLVPLVMAILLRMLQDCRHRLWPWFLAQVPTAVIAVVGIATHHNDTLDFVHYWQIAVSLSFVVYYLFALVRYGRWLRENYADLEHKEFWQSLLFVIFLFIFYEIYSTNPGIMSREYVAQLNSIVIIAFLLWRVETLQQLEESQSNEISEETEADGVAEDTSRSSTPLPANIGLLLEKHCVKKHLYLQHDLTLQQLSEKLGTNRTYISQYLAQQGMTYNTYINGLRINHFERLFRENTESLRPFTVQQLLHESGFRSYSTFYAAFKQLKGQSATDWMREQTS